MGANIITHNHTLWAIDFHSRVCGCWGAMSDGNNAEEKKAEGRKQCLRRRRRTIFILIDGLADVCFDKPLERLPNLHAISEHGVNGLQDPVRASVACGSDVAHLSLLGYDPAGGDYRGRGFFEALGAGLLLAEGDIGFKACFGTVDDATGVVLQRRCDEHFPEWGRSICADLTDTPIRLPSFPSVRVEVKYSTEHRCGVKLSSTAASGIRLSDAISGTDPYKDGLPLGVSLATHSHSHSHSQNDEDDDAKVTAAIVNEASQVLRELTSAHPLNESRRLQQLPHSNVVLLRAPASVLELPPLADKWGLTEPFFIAPTALVAGVCLSLGMRRVTVQGATGEYDSDLKAKAHACVDQLLAQPECNFAFVHVKAVDEAGHAGDKLKKIEMMEKADVMVGEVLRRLPELFLADPGCQLNIVVTGDHSTSVESKDHCSDPVQFTAIALTGPQLSSSLYRDQTRFFHEVDASRGILGRFPGSQVMHIINKL